MLQIWPSYNAVPVEFQLGKPFFQFIAFGDALIQGGCFFAGIYGPPGFVRYMVSWMSVRLRSRAFILSWFGL
jgi:hypothetical protein